VWGRGMSKYKGKFPTMLYVNGKAPRWGGGGGAFMPKKE